MAKYPLYKPIFDSLLRADHEKCIVQDVLQGEKKNKLIYLCETVIFALKDNFKTGGTILKESKHDVLSIGRSTSHIHVQVCQS